MTVLVALLRAPDFAYLAEEPRILAGRGADPAWEPRLLSAEVQTGLGFDPAAIRDLLAGSPTSFSAALNGNRRAASMVEMVVAAPKWVSVAAAIGTGAERDLVLAAHRGAVAAVQGRIAKDLIWTRAAHRGARLYYQGEQSDGVEFVHLLSRGLDPHLHSHLLVPNAVLGPGDVWRSLDVPTLRLASGHLDLVYLAELERGLAPLALDAQRFACADLQRPSREALTKEFSRRSQAIRAERDVSGGPARVARLKTRDAKPDGITLETLQGGWRSRASALATETISIEHAYALEPEIQAVAGRLADRQAKFGAGVLDAELESAGSGGVGEIGALSYEGLLLDEELVAGRPADAAEGFVHPPPRQRVYSVRDLAALETAIGTLRARGDGVVTGTFRPPLGLCEVDSLESVMRSLGSQGVAFVTPMPESSPDRRSLGKAASASMAVVGRGSPMPAGSALVVSPVISPGEISSMLRSGTGSRGILFADARRVDVHGDPIGRGSGWRAWLSSRLDQAELDSKTKARDPSLVLQDGSLVFESTSQLATDLAARIEAGAEFVAAEPWLAAAIIERRFPGRADAGSVGWRERFASLGPMDPSSLAQARVLEDGRPLHLMVAPIVPVASAEDTRLVTSVLGLAALRTPDFWARCAPAAGKTAIDVDTRDLEQLRRANLDLMSGLGRRSTAGDDAPAHVARQDALGDRLRRLLLSPLAVPGLDADPGTSVDLPRRLLAVLDSLEAHRAELSIESDSRAPSSFLLRRAVTLATAELDRRAEVEPALARSDRHLELERSLSLERSGRGDPHPVMLGLV